MSRKVVFLASGNGGTLKFFYYAIQVLNLPFEINMVIADRYCGAIQFAQGKNIKSKVVNYSKNSDRELVELLKNIDADIVITNIHKILTLDVLKSIKADFINLHYLLLPAFAGLIGMKTVDEARKQNCQFVGATCHKVTEECDSGKILAQGLSPVNWTEENLDIMQVYNKVFRIACICFLNALMEKYLNSEVNYESAYGYFNPKCRFDTMKLSENFWEKLNKD